MNWPGYTGSDVLRGLTIYAIGDTIATLILGEFLWTRLAGLMAVGGLVYAWEIPNYFRWIDRRPIGRWRRTALAILYFNPLWIARHVAFIHLFSGRLDLLNLDLLRVGTLSFLCNLPVSLAGNYVIQNVIPLRYRFISSAIFSTMLAVYYAISARWFN
jgi:hypothetical protein